MQRFESLQNFDVFAMGCKVFETHIDIQILWLQPKRLQALRGSVQELVESRKADGQKFKVLIPNDYTEMWTEARLERV